jgi:C4-dicarboxylate-binding protein DctP
MPWIGLLTALPHGLIDAQENTIVNIVQAGLYEYQSYLTITNHMYTAIIPAVSPLFWDSLSAGDQELISQVMLEAQEAGRQKALIAEEKYMRYLTDTGVKVTELSAEQFQKFQAAAHAVWPMITDIMGQNEFDRLVSFVSALRN